MEKWVNGSNACALWVSWNEKFRPDLAHGALHFPDPIQPGNREQSQPDLGHLHKAKPLFAQASAHQMGILNQGISGREWGIRFENEKYLWNPWLAIYMKTLFLLGLQKYWRAW